MNQFSYLRAQSIDTAVAALGNKHSRLVAGGTNVLDLMKAGIETPQLLVDINHLPLDDVHDTADGGLWIGSLVRNSDLANHAIVRTRYPLLAQALLAGASPQLRNMATVGGNLMQRTRCYYFNDIAFPNCNKRTPGSGCAAREGFSRIHAILGASEQCVATHPSDMCVGLLALDAIIEVQGAKGTRRIPMADFHRLPGDTPQIDTNLESGELILGVELPQPRFASNSYYMKIRDRASYAFALVSVAAALSLEAGRIADARVILGGVAHKPWRAAAVERLLIGRPFDAAAIDRASEAAADGAVPLRDNAFKIGLARTAVARALRAAGGLA